MSEQYSQQNLLAPAVLHSPTVDDIRRLLGRYRLPVSTESALQLAMAKAFTDEGVIYQREVTRGADRIDFVIGSVGIECKIHDSVTQVTRQLQRYAEWPQLETLILVTACGHHKRLNLAVLNDKSVLVHVVRGVLF